MLAEGENTANSVEYDEMDEDVDGLCGVSREPPKHDGALWTDPTGRATNHPRGTCTDSHEPLSCAFQV